MLEALHQALSPAYISRTPQPGPEFYLETSLMFAKNRRYREALDVLRKGQQKNPGDGTLLLGEAVVDSLGDQSAQAKEALALIEKQRPEWSRVYLIKGAGLERTGDYAGALPPSAHAESQFALAAQSARGQMPAVPPGRTER